jgi:glutamate-1-semialdehyde aminotransferase/spore coat polysaccharide biosynthesis protein SpsF (cytidylyltransferase family)
MAAVAVVQCRMSSTRLPGKMLLPLCGKPLLLQLAERLGHARSLDRVLLATSTSPADDAIEQLANDHHLPCFRGSEEDVLDRYYQALRDADEETVVRITGDCPLIDPAAVDHAIARFRRAGCDYALHPRPEGMDIEVFTRAALERAWSETSDPTDREHVTPYLRLSGKFSVIEVEPETDVSRVRNGWSVDTEADFQFVRAVYEQLYPHNPSFGLRDILKLLEERPELMAINGNQIRNEGYYLSIAKSPEECAPISRSLERSQALKRRALEKIPSCTQTFSKGPTQYVQGVAPVFLTRGEGSHVWDADNNEYIDHPMALGAVILGHSYPPVTAAVRQAIEGGTAFSLPHPLEIELAELLCDMVPCAEMVRFGKNGSDATAATVRAARALTGREMIACCGYHGWQDWYIGTTTRDRGVPKATAKLTKTFRYNDLPSLEQLFRAHPGQIAGVILEPVGVEEPKPGFLEGVRELAHQQGALLIFDEVVTGFRLAPGGAQEYFGVVPDLAALGKAMGNGFSISAVAGKREFMEVFDEIFFSTTFGGETVGLAAALATLKILRGGGVLERIREQGQKLQEGFRTLAAFHGLGEVADCVGLPARTVVLFRDAAGTDSLTIKSYFQQECLKRGILFSGNHNVCFSHSDADVDRTLRVYDTALRKLRTALEAGNLSARLEGAAVEAVFRKP